MCLIFIALNHHPDFKLVVAGNRDEFYARRTAPADFWETNSNVLAGRDLEAMGTWLGVTRSGRIAMLTNYRDLSKIDPAAPSRGRLVSDFLETNVVPARYLESVHMDSKPYNGFNLLTGTFDELWYYSNYGVPPQRLGNGLYGLSNHLLDTPWPKVVRGKEKFRRHLAMGAPDPEELFRILYDEDVAHDAHLPSTGLPLDRERALSAMFIKTEGYGSRCSTVIIVDRDDNVFFAERVFDTVSFAYDTREFNFTAR